MKIPNEGRVIVSISLFPSLLTAIDKHAKKHGLQRSPFMREIIESFLKESEEWEKEEKSSLHDQENEEREDG